MPELPEVEVIRLKLRRYFEGRCIARVRARRASQLFLTSPRLLQRQLVGRTAESLERVGKYLIARLDDGQRLVLHLGMTGQLFAVGTTRPAPLVRDRRRGGPDQPEPTPDRHTHLRLGFADQGPEVWLRDVRRFGKVLLLPAGVGHRRLDRLGVDALSGSGEWLYRAARRRQVPVKTLLLDQSVLAGVGNIYADEALFASGIRPTKRACRLSRAQCELLVDAIRRLLLRSIELGGTTVSDFRDPDGGQGGYQQALRVYARTGQPCWRCHEPVQRVVLAQRSSHYCRRCQK
jgi:formamidopyrimidine-DNA glycosylase